MKAKQGQLSSLQYKVVCLIATGQTFNKDFLICVVCWEWESRYKAEFLSSREGNEQPCRLMDTSSCGTGRPKGMVVQEELIWILVTHHQTMATRTNSLSKDNILILYQTVNKGWFCKLFLKELRVNFYYFKSPIVSVTTIQFCHHCTKRAMDSNEQ